MAKCARVLPLFLLALLAAVIPLSRALFQAAGSANFTRAPYLQSAGQTSMTVVWNLDVAVTGVFRWGRTPGPNWEFSQNLPAQTINVVTLTTLQPDTRYYYEVEADALVLATGADYYFDTYPPVNGRKPFSFLAWGDSGTDDANQDNVAARMNEVVPRPAFGLGIGDLIYPAGEAANYNPRYFQPYAPILRNMVIWPAMGNHDAGTASGQPYLDAFYCPTNTGAAGSPSNTELYYSFDYGMAHFTCLDSQVTYNAGTSARNAMLTWFTADLDAAVARGQRWKVVYFHHPPYTKGTHNSDTEAQLIWMRNNLNPIMEARGVDFVLCGHSHVYERSYLLKNSAVLQNNASDYSKISTPDGSIYIVTGCGGQTGSGSLNHPLMAYSLGSVAGNTVIDVQYDECRGYFVRQDGVKLDLFNLRKAADTLKPWIADCRAASDSSVRVTYSEPVQSGTGANGSENVANYSISGGVTISAAVLQSDGRTVVLTTTAHSSNIAYTLTVNNVRDRAASPNTILANSKAYYTAPASLGIAQGASWKYIVPSANISGWFGTAFNDSAWASGNAGFGYADGDDATVVANGTMSVYIRKTISVPNAASVTGLRLYNSYDDGFVAYINGQEVARVGVSGTPPAWNATGTNHEAAGFELFDLASHISKLTNGSNVIALEIHNQSGTSSDLSLHPYLEIDGGQGGNQPPVARLTCDVTTLNTPGTVNFDAASSSDPDGSIVSYLWDFGDGTATASTAAAAHVYTAQGLFTATLIVTDNSGAQALARQTIVAHNVGTAPTAQITPGPTTVTPGTNVNFSSAGSADPDGGAVYLFWVFDDPASGIQNISTAASPSHTFNSLGTYDVRLTVTDDEGSQTVAMVTITVNNPSGPTITTTTLPAGTVGTAYNQTLAATGGTGGYTWTMESGTLPTTLTLSTSGVISGTPTVAGVFNFAVRCTDGAALFDTQGYSVTINAPGSPTITTTTLPNGTVGVAYNQTLNATGGTPSYTWTLDSGTLPASVSLSGAGVISGTPTVAATSNFVVRVTDSLSQTTTQALSIIIDPAGALTITITTLPAAIEGQVYSQELSASGGTPPLVWTIISGALPAGLSLSGAGVISGSSTVSGNFPFTVSVSDGASNSATQPLTLLVNPASSSGGSGNGGNEDSGCTTGEQALFAGIITLVAVVIALFARRRSAGNR